MRQRIALNVRTVRAAKGLTVQEAASRCEMHWRHWQRVEAGTLNATLYTLVRVASALDVDPGQLLAVPERKKPAAS